MQFISILWKSLCKWLSISLQLFIIYHSQINDQSKQVNQNIKRYLQFFCSYMQNDWFKWLLMIEFINNNVLFSIIFLIFFFINKSFHSRISFDFDIIKYESICKCLQIIRIEDIFNHINKILIFTREALIKTWKQMMKQINKHRKEINYKIKSKMFLNERNIITAKLFKKLDDKMLNSFKITDSVDFFYKLELSDTMHIYNVFHSEFLRFIVNDSLFDQKNESSRSIVINDEDEWKINNILNFQWYRRWL